MSGRSIRLLIGVLGTIWAVGGEAIAMSAGKPASSGLLHLAIGLTYLFGGLAIWDHEPANRTGRLMTLVGLTWFIGTLDDSGIPIVNEIALALEDTTTVLLLALILAYPSGRLETRVDRVAVAILAVGATTLNILYSTSLPLITDKSSGLYGGLALATLSTLVVLRRWLIAPPRTRPELGPVLVAGMVFVAGLMINLIRRIFELPEGVEAILLAIRDLAPAAIPIALLVGFYRQSERRLQALVDAIPDRMFRFTRDGRFVDSSVEDGGSPSNGSSGDGDQADRRLAEEMFATAGAVARTSADRALETGELQAYDFSLSLPSGPRDFEARIAPSGSDEVTAIVRDFTDQRAAEAELRRSRTRMVEAADQERRRLERDLHDGAQQRLVAVSLALRLLRKQLDTQGVANEAAVAAADRAAAELKLAIQELRELARGIHPAILTEAGLGPAISSLAERCAVPTVVGALPDRRLSTAVEATAYFVVSESLANVAKYASATQASVEAECRGSILHLEVGDNGVGGADAARGSGIRGLEDRVAALGGRIAIESPAGQGTLVVAEIPLD